MKIKPISGFPELLPEEEIFQQDLLDRIRRSFELHGFGPIRTRAVEPVDILVTKGEIDKEIYGVHRLAAAAGGDTAEASLGLHYDLTVPFARYVSERRGQLVFPFRRYQIQSAWRGERPQLGRYREFIQADADIIGEQRLDVRYDAEMMALLVHTLDELPIPPVKVLLNNRKLLQGFYLGLEVPSVVDVLRCIDKIPKIGVDEARRQLGAGGLSEAKARACIELSQLELDGVGGLGAVRELGVQHPLLDEGITELEAVLSYCRERSSTTQVVAALHIARGFDYYTGSVVEGVLADHPQLGSICSGGRYDELASTGGVALPGVGISIGVSRIVGYLSHLGLLTSTRRSPADVFVIVHDEAQRNLSDTCAARLRTRGINCLVADKAQAYGKQIKAAVKLGIPYVWFPAQAGGAHEVKDLASERQEPADLERWAPE